MELKVEVSYYNEDTDETTEEEVNFPARHVVCARCDGHGTHLTPSIGKYAYSAEEFYESFPEEEDREEYFKRGGIYDVTCEQCKGKRVVKVIDDDRIKMSGDEELKKHYARYLENRRDEAEYEAECRAERRMEAMMLGEYEFGYSD